MSTNPYAWIDRALQTLHQANWYRSVKPLDSLPGAVVRREGRTLINFASNDYLGLTGDSRLIEAATAATQKYGTGSTGSRLLSGHRPLHRELEIAIAQLKQTEDAIVFSSGYLANLGAISCLVGKRDLILGDEYNHSCLKNGAVLSGATLVEYRHGNLEDLTAKLEGDRSYYRRCLIATDSVFSMDGDLAPLPQLLDLAASFECMVLVDEAHATGVLGTTGAGCVEHWGCSGRAIAQMGTLSKALGSLGGYVAGSSALIDYLRNRAATWIYTTGLSPADTAAALAAIQIIQEEPQRREALWEKVRFLKKELTNYDLLPSASPILCLKLSTPEQALIAAQHLETARIFAPAIRPPTVPSSRIRFTVMATHTREHLQQLVEAIAAIKDPFNSDRLSWNYTDF